jgi:2-hydroxychromene-2-carboxylate isomerase
MGPAPSTAGQRTSRRRNVAIPSAERSASVARATFFYDLGSPYSYLAAERVNGLFAEHGIEPPEWQPILLGGLFKRFDRESWGVGPGRLEGMQECERRAAARGLPPFRWPDPWPGNMLYAMRAATFAKQLGRSVSFPLAAFRQAFAAGRDLSDPESVMIAAAAAEIHPRALATAVERDSTKARLRDATERAGDLGVRGVPAVVVAEQVFWGDDRLVDAVAAATG